MLLFNDDFKSSQMKNFRVRETYSEKEKYIRNILKEKGISSESVEIFLRIFKKEKTVELWAKNSKDTQFVYLKEYSICSLSGNFGPKRKQGDLQVPEGFYAINMFNPASNFYLSLGIDYPNKSDRILSRYKNPGGSIFIHGSCVTIGCIPITDDKIKELYILALESKNNGQEKIPVHIFPARLNETGFRELNNSFASDTGLIGFWRNLKEGFDYFEKFKRPPAVNVKKSGKYFFN